MEKEGKNSWDRANAQGENIDFNSDDATEKFLKEDDSQPHHVEERNPNKDADGYGSESARSDHSHFDSGLGSRKGNNDSGHSHTSSRSNENLGDSSQGASGRSS